MFLCLGIDLRDEGRVSEAFVFLNHYLDICDAIEGEVELVDHTDLLQTDLPSSIPIPDHLYLRNTLHIHESIKEWVLAVSMDQKVDQVHFCCYFRSGNTYIIYVLDFAS